MLHWEIMQLRLVIGLVVLLSMGAVVGLAHEVLTPANALDSGPILVDIPAHDGVLDIAGRLYRAAAIRSRVGFVLLAGLRGNSRQLKAGEYELARGASTLDVLKQIEAGRVKQHLVLHPEGATMTELARVLENERLAPGGAVARLATDRAFLTTLGIDGPSIEGYLFPDTYQLVRGLTTEEILTRMVQRLRAKASPDLTARAQARGLSVHQLLTLASIIEREAVDRDELRTLTRADLTTDHPYNTYRRSGLPPGPIASPGLAAIEAALDPAPVKYLYFVAMDDHRHYFSASLGEHNAAVARYRLARAR